jgi:hypothetical protein
VEDKLFCRSIWRFLLETVLQGNFSGDYLRIPAVHPFTTKQRIYLVAEALKSSYRLAVEPVIGLFEYNPSKESEQTYGEILTLFVQELAEITSANENSKFFDAGVGIGQAALQMSALTGCESFGIELDTRRLSAYERFKASFLQECWNRGIRCGNVQLYHGDFSVTDSGCPVRGWPLSDASSTTLAALLSQTSIFWMNNVKFHSRASLLPVH